jgi:hypothetical protein
MALTIKSLAMGVITSTGSTAVYTVGGGKAAIVSSVSMCYSGSLSFTGEITATISGTTVKVSVPTSGTRILVTDKITLSSGDSINCNIAATPSAGELIVVVSGFERDV